MMNKARKYIKIIAAMLCCAAVIFSAVLCAHAASPTYNMSADYKGGRYYENFREVDLVGDGARDTLAIALSQLGYHEGNDDAGRDGLSIDGDRDYVEYNVLYGKLDNNQGNGISYGYYWCASFVNWCLRQAEVSKEASAAAEVSCRRWLAACKDSGIYNEKEGYIPKSADIVFFKEADSAVTSTHMGLVLYCEGDTVYTIEGNTSNGSEFSTNGNYVALKSYSLSSSYIVGYATPKYTRAEGIGELDYSGKTFGVGKYIATADISIYSDNSFTAEIGKIDAFSIFEVERVENNALYINGGCVKAENIKQMTAKNNIRSISYLNSSGKKLYSNQYAERGAEVLITSEIPERSSASFVGWLINGTDEMISPGETFVLSDNVELYAIYDDTRPEDITETNTAESEEITTEALAVTTASVTNEKTERVTENITEGETESFTEQVEIASESNQASVSAPQGLLGGCTSTVGAVYGVATIIAIAAGIFLRKRKNMV